MSENISDDEKNDDDSKIFMSRWSLEEETEELERKVDYLQKAILVILMNPNLYEMLQQTLLLEIHRARSKKGEAIYTYLYESIQWETIFGPGEISIYDLDKVTRGLYNKLESYAKFGNLNGYFMSRKMDIFFVGQQEHLERDYWRLIEKLGLKNMRGLLEITRPGANANLYGERGFNTFLSPLAKETLKEWYKTDYEFLELLQERGLLNCE